jgi:hypothetical protein
MMTMRNMNVITILADERGNEAVLSRRVFAVAVRREAGLQIEAACPLAIT